MKIYLPVFVAGLILSLVGCSRIDPEEKTSRILLTSEGGDRATAYTMNNKVLIIDEGILCTWIDHQRQNKWALLSHGGEIIRQGSIGTPRIDNHCGASLAVDPNGVIHAVLGGHSSPVDHYLINDVTKDEWSHLSIVDGKITYPSLVSDQKGQLHMTFRNSEDSIWSLGYCRYENGEWTDPEMIVKAAKPGYVYWTNTLTVGKDNTIHLFFANVRLKEEGLLYHGASHLHSMDGGQTWQDLQGNSFSLPVSATELPLLEGEEQPERLATSEYLMEYNIPGPTSKEYLQMILSNATIDQHGTCHILLHNGIDGTVKLMSQQGKSWRSRSLMAPILRHDPGSRVHVQSSLTAAGNYLYAGLMIEDTETNTWGPNGTYTVVLRINGDKIELLPITSQNTSGAQWLSALPHQNPVTAKGQIPLMYTDGKNAGGFSANKNELTTKVWTVLIENE